MSIIPRSFIHYQAKQAAKYVNPTLNAIQLIPRSFIHCRAKREKLVRSVILAVVPSHRTSRAPNYLYPISSTVAYNTFELESDY